MSGLFSLNGKRGLVVGVANEASIAYACAQACHQQGAQQALTYLNDKAYRHVAACAESVAAERLLPCDVRNPGELEQVFQAIEDHWGGLDYLVHSIAFAPREDLHGRVTDCSRDGFLEAMDVSCHSFVRMARLAEPLMRDGGSLLTVSFYGAEKVVEHYNLMGPVKAALESSVGYLAAELGASGIRVNALSPGPLRTRAASGINRFDELLEQAVERTPSHQLADPDDVGALAAYLVGDRARSVTGEVIHVDAGYHVMG